MARRARVVRRRRLLRQTAQAMQDAARGRHDRREADERDGARPAGAPPGATADEDRDGGRPDVPSRPR